MGTARSDRTADDSAVVSRSAPDEFVPADDSCDDCAVADPPVALMTTIVAITATTKATGTSAVTRGCRLRNDVWAGARPTDFFVPVAADRVEDAPFEGRLLVGRVGPELDFDM